MTSKITESYTKREDTLVHYSLLHEAYNFIV